LPAPPRSSPKSDRPEQHHSSAPNNQLEPEPKPRFNARKKGKQSPEAPSVRWQRWELPADHQRGWLEAQRLLLRRPEVLRPNPPATATSAASAPTKQRLRRLSPLLHLREAAGRQDQIRAPSSSSAAASPSLGGVVARAEGSGTAP
jgi:hypothetical protein